MKKLSLIFMLLFYSVVFWPPTQPVHALGQRVYVKKARNFAANQEYTVSQIVNATKQQILTVTGLTDLNEIAEFAQYWPGIKIMLLNDAIERRTRDRMVLLKQQLNNAYPDAVGLDTQYAKDIARQLLLLLYGEVDPNAID